MYNNGVQIYINDLLAEKPLVLKMVNIAQNCMRVVLMDSLSNSVKRSDVTRRKQGYVRLPLPYFILWNAVTSLGEKRVYNTPPPYFIVLASSVKTKEVMVIEFHRINKLKWCITKDNWAKINGITLFSKV